MSARFVRFVRRVLILAVIVALGLIAGWLFFDKSIDERIRDELASRLQQQYPVLEVDIHSARRIEGKGIEIRGFSITDPNAGDAGRPVVEVDEILAVCSTELADLLAGEVAVRHLTIRRMTVHATRQSDGEWNLARMLPLPRLGNNSPTATIENGTIQLLDLTSTSPAQLTLRNINVTASPDLDAAPPRNGEKPPLRVRGTMEGEHFKHIEIDARLDPTRGLWSASGVADELELSPEFRRALPVDAAAQLAPLAALQCRAQLNYSISNLGGAGQPLLFAVTGSLLEGRIDDPHLPYPLTDVFADVQCDNNGLTVSNLAANGGGAALTGSLQVNGFGPSSSWTLNLVVNNLTLDERLAERLPENARAAWGHFAPSGVVDANLTLNYDGAQYRPELTVDCANVSFAYREFPLRLTDGSGRIELKNNVITFNNLTARASGEPVTIRGEVVNPGPQSTGWAEVSLERPIPVDRSMLAAIEQRPVISRTINSFHPRGMITFWGRFEKDDPNQHMPRQTMRIGLHDCALRFKGFPYPLYNIGGLISVKDQKWEFVGLSGTNDSAYVQCHGDWTPQADGGTLWLSFDARDAPLEDELRAALPPASRELWSKLRPRGTIDRLKIDLTFKAPSNELSLDITAEKHPGLQDVAGRSITIQPQWFPYRLEQVTGRARYLNGVIALEEIAAVHGPTTVEFSGEFRNEPGRWSMLFSSLRADRLRLDRDLIAALPHRLGEAVGGLRLSAPAAMSGWLALAGDARVSPQPAVRWDLKFDVQNSSLYCGTELEHLFGGVHLFGASDHRGLRCRGEVDIDSMFYKDIQITQISGPLWIDDTRLALGAWTPPDDEGAAPRRLTGKTLGGSVVGDVQFELSGSRQFNVQGRLSDANLALIARDMLPAGQLITGKAHAGVRLRGTTEGAHTLLGDGWVQLREADIYKLPLMVQMLKLLTVREPDPTAFTTAVMRFNLEGEHLYFNPINFEGDAISLKGSGEMDFQKNLNLEFYTLLGRDESRPAFLRPLFNEAGRQFMRINVVGPLNRPHVQPTPLPGLDRTIQQLFPEAADSQSSMLPSVPNPKGILRQANLWPW